MNNSVIMDVDPLSSYEGQYDYPMPHYYHPTHPTPPAYPYKTDELCQPHPTTQPENPVPEFPLETTMKPEEPQEEEDIKPDIVPKEEKEKKRSKLKGRTSSYWNKKITEKDFAFYGCSICNIAYTDLQKLDRHVTIHANRMTSYDLRLQNMKKRKRLKKEKKKQKQKKGAKIKEEIEVEIKPEDGYIGTEIASEFSENDNKSDIKKCTSTTENNENNPVNNVDQNVNVYKCFGCQKQFALSYYLRIHVRSHTDEKPYTCSVCGQNFITASKMGRHNKRVHLAIRHQCRICYRHFSRFELLVKHFDAKHAEDKLDGEPYDYNAILPYIKEIEMEEQLKKEKEKENAPKTEDPWDTPNAFETEAQVTVDVPKTEAFVAKEEEFVSKEEDKVIIPSNLVFYDENESETITLPTANIIIGEVKVDVDIKKETDDHSDVDQGDGDQCVDLDCGFQDDRSDHSDDGMDDKVKKTEEKKDPGSDEEYFPSDTWVRSPSPIRSPTTKSKNGQRTSICPICNKKLSSKSYLRVHLRTHTGEKPFACYICKRKFITASKMHRHVLTHDESWEGNDDIKTEDGEGSEIKPEVKSEVDEEAELDETPKKKIKKKSTKKPKSKLIKKNRSAFFEKKTKKHEKWEHTCEYCHQRFLHLETLQVHKKSHEGPQSMKCNFCLELFEDKDAFKDHEATHTGPKPYQCSYCGNTYKKKGTMVYHRNNRCRPGAAEDKCFVCDICSKRYNSQSKLQRHIISHSVNKFTLRYECPVCAHMFNTRWHVQMHLKSHMKEGLILEENRNEVLAMVLQNARKIPKSTTDDITAPVAQPVPNDERSRICNICGQIFQHFYYLEEHLKTHGSKIALQDFDKEEEKKYTCQVCSKSFKLHYYLKLHSFTHMKERPYMCQQCGKGFITKGKLKRHLETHQGLKKYQCHICYKFFTRPSYMRIHIRTIHGTQDYHFRDYGIGVPIGAIAPQ